MTFSKRLIAYETVEPNGFELCPAGSQRAWMDHTYDRSAYRCLPVQMANQAGWVIGCPATIRVRWDGGPLLKAVEIQRWSGPHQGGELPDYCWPASHFGVGIITWTLPYLFRTPQGYNLLARGPANCPKDGIAPLEGLVETDWTPATFTMNWQITRPDHWISFQVGEPICMVVPQRRGELEEFEPLITPLEADPAEQAAFENWTARRDHTLATQGWEKDYMRGQCPNGEQAQEHQIRLHLRRFTRANPGQVNRAEPELRARLSP